MAATTLLSQPRKSHNSVAPKSGVIVLYGYGTQVRVDRGHLVINDGIGLDRRSFRLPRVGHGLSRLVAIGSDGFISLAALRWLADQDSAFVMLERDGTVLATTGPVRPSDARLRRAQALAVNSGTALKINCELITQKLMGQARVVREQLQDTTTAELISGFQSQLAEADTQETIRSLEALAGGAYWAAWRHLPITYPRNDLPRVPEHWRVFGNRKSMLSGSQRRATNPVNAMLNYLYAILESEARLAAAAMGLDPGLGMLHVDTPNRDSLACDLMEPIRPKIDAYVLDWFTRQPLKREWFFEQRDGNCRLMGPFAVRLSETAPTWRRQVAPFVEWMARTLWADLRKPKWQSVPATRLTQQRRSEGRGKPAQSQDKKASPNPETLCRYCGKQVESGRKFCKVCGLTFNRESLTALARRGRVVARGVKAQHQRSETQRRNISANYAWDPSSQPSWLTEEYYGREIQPRLWSLTCSTISKTLKVSMPYAAEIRIGRRPHPRHWRALAQLAGPTPR
jgi:CRISPR-associated endonuclease Cas1